MAQSEHLPIYKRGYELCRNLEQVVRGFSRSNRYGLGDGLRSGARRVLTPVARANSRREREAALLTIREEFEALMVSLRLAHDLRALRPEAGPETGGRSRTTSLASQPLPSWNQLWRWLRELDERRKTPAEEGGFVCVAAG